ncbi:acetyltransferase [Devosia limi DSM 17137]|uniref:Acetyltransferase n=1 Tax=Devosia limi DSM 17137 TaxID=1121477 RepID=A0A0F5LRR1_9HYPH|nr:GNAT family N-acetyltransferase [Devosia limi]KKB84996.1 acetyltransferase [Devosia limi DSM 17137]SHF02036.1 Acetyltransferase (GNAT) family protein [Devosia limi DSM 17137]
MSISLELTHEPDEADLAAIGKGLTDYNAADVGPSGRVPLAVLVRDESGALAGGLSGYTAWGWLYVQWLWLSEPMRGQGLAGKLLAMAEAEASRRGCHGAYIDTFNPAALRLYQRQGYAAFGELPEFPKGRTRTFLQKPLQP